MELPDGTPACPKCGAPLLGGNVNSSNPQATATYPQDQQGSATYANQSYQQMPPYQQYPHGGMPYQQGNPAYHQNQQSNSRGFSDCYPKIRAGIYAVAAFILLLTVSLDPDSIMESPAIWIIETLLLLAVAIMNFIYVDME